MLPELSNEAVMTAEEEQSGVAPLESWSITTLGDPSSSHRHRRLSFTAHTCDERVQQRGRVSEGAVCPQSAPRPS